LWKAPSGNPVEKREVDNTREHVRSEKREHVGSEQWVSRASTQSARTR
jgi:hypothetical protein